jgi:hypothetical protein
LPGNEPRLQSGGLEGGRCRRRGGRGCNRAGQAVDPHPPPPRRRNLSAPHRAALSPRLHWQASPHCW